MRKCGLLCLICLSLSFCTIAAPAEMDRQFRQANEAYVKKDYNRAAKLYEELIAGGCSSASLFYNYGNVCYRQNELAQALLWYERALRLDPSDDDIRANIAFVNTQTVDQMEVLPEFFLKRWWTKLGQSLSLTAWAVLSIILAFLMAGLLVWSLLSAGPGRRVRLLFVSIAVFILLIISVLICFSQRRQLSVTEAIVTDLSVTVKSTPDVSGTDLFTVHEGMKVRQTDRMGDWVEVVFPNGNKGWILKKQMETI